MDINKTTGTDMIGPRLLKLAAPYIADEVTFICNHSISNSVFPTKWKEAKITPLHKRGPHEDVNNTDRYQFYPFCQKYLKNTYMIACLNFFKNLVSYIKHSQVFEHTTHVKLP